MWDRIAVDSGAMLPATITHGLISTTRMHALDMLRRFINAKPAVRSAIIFVNDPHRVEVVVRELYEMGLVAAPLHGDSSKDDRKEIISRLKDGRLRLVVATELAARGLDIPDLSHVINFELPTDAQHYVHRYITRVMSTFMIYYIVSSSVHFSSQDWPMRSSRETRAGHELC